MYLDYAATTPLSDKTKQYIISLLDNFQNPSSLYQSGKDIKDMIETSRENIAAFINTDPNNIIFTSGGSASNTLAINGFMKEHPNDKIYYSPIAHKSILKCIKALNVDSVKIPIKKDGCFNLEKLRRMVEDDYYNLRCPFVIVDAANSEIGTIQDLERLTQITHDYCGVIYADCTGYIPTVPLDVRELKVDMVGFSAHKLGSLKGTGVLYKSSDIDISPLVYGTQEQGLFGGTENTLGICVLGEVVKNYDYSKFNTYQRDYVYDFVKRNIPGGYLVGSVEHRLVNNLYLCFKEIKGSSLMALLDIDGIQISTGSACNNYSSKPSTVLTELGICKHDLDSCIRITFSCSETQEELDYLCKKLKDNVELFLR